MKLTHKYYLKAKIIARYSGFRRGDFSSNRKIKYQIRDLLNTEITSLIRTEEYNPKFLVIDDEYLFFPELYGVLFERDNVFFRVNLTNVYITNIHVSEHGKDGIYSFGKLEGIIVGTIEKSIEETVLPEVLTYIDSSEEKQIKFINNTSGTRIPVDETTIHQKEDNEIKPVTSGKHIGFGDILGWLFLLFIGVILIVSFWQYIGITLLTFGGIYFLSWLAGAAKQIIRFIFGALVILGLLSWLFTTTSSFKGQRQAKKTDRKKEVTEIRKDTTRQNKGDSILISHHRIWKDYDGSNYETDLLINQSDYFSSKKYHFNFTDGGFSSESAFWNTLYRNFSVNDTKALYFIYDKFDSIGRKNNLDQVQFANMVVSCIQDIPYVLIANLDCDTYKKENPADIDIIRNTGCYGPVKFGVQSPVEFMYNLKGDCDTRTLFCYTVLSHFKYDVAILLSNQYRHSVLGVSIPVRGAFKNYNGKKYYLWETTAPNCAPGFMAPDFGNLNYWDFILISN